MIELLTGAAEKLRILSHGDKLADRDGRNFLGWRPGVPAKSRVLLDGEVVVRGEHDFVGWL